MYNTDRDALREPWRVRPLFARCALELQENDKVRVTLFGMGKLPYTYLAPANISSVLQTFLDASTYSRRRIIALLLCRATNLLDRAAHLTRSSGYVYVLGPFSIECITNKKYPIFSYIRHNDSLVHIEIQYPLKQNPCSFGSQYRR